MPKKVSFMRKNKSTSNPQGEIKIGKEKKRIKTMIPMKDKMGKVKMGTRLTGRQAVPNLAAMMKRGIITSMD